MAKLTQDQWLDVRSKWEADSCVSFSALANQYSITKQVICSRAKKEGWKRQCNLAFIVQEAVKRADTFFEKTDEKADDKTKTDESPCLKENIGLDSAIDLRTNVLVKHRGQIVTLDEMQNEAKSLFAEALEAQITLDNAGDDKAVKVAKNLWWQAKIAADVLKDHCSATKIKHDAERKCWAMDEGELSPHDLESFSDAELDYFGNTGKIPVRFQKIFRGYKDD